MSGKQEWRDFICAPERAGRHLSVIGQAVQGATDEPIDEAVLRAFLERLENSTDDARVLRNAVDLLNGPYLGFVRSALPDLLGKLVSENPASEERVGPGLRGNVRWDRTAVARRAGTLPPSYYVSRLARRTFDLPENALVAWLVHNLLEACVSVEAAVGSRNIHPLLREIDTRCSEAADVPALQEGTRGKTLTDSMIAAAKRQRDPMYRKAATLAERRFALENEGRTGHWYELLSLLKVNWLAPVDDNDLFELYVLVLTLDVIEEELAFGGAEAYGLVTSSRGAIATYRAHDRTVRVFFDQAPPAPLGATTRLKALSPFYATFATLRARRPDVTVTVDGLDDASRTFIIEAKRTDDGRYMSDSIYKMFGYMFDLASLLPKSGSRAVLITPNGAEPRPGHVGEPLIVCSGNDRDHFGSTLKALIFGST